MHPSIEAQFPLIEKEINGIPSKVFAKTPACLSELFRLFDEFADREFILQDTRRVSYAELQQDAARLSAHLSGAMHIKPGSRVGIALPNSIEWCVAFVAIAALGAVPVLINPRGSAAELHHCLTSTHCAAWLGDDRAVTTYNSSHRTTEDSPLRAPYNSLHRAAEGSPLRAPHNSFLQEAAEGSPLMALPHTPRQPEDEAILMFTSGTTGRAKAASLTHIGVLTALKTIQYSGALITAQLADQYGMDYDTLLSMRPPPVTMLVFPLFHVSGCHAVFLTSLVQGAKIVVLPKWEPDAALALIAAEKVTAFPGVPTMYWDLLKSAEHTHADLTSLSSISIGGQATPPALLARVHAAFPQSVLGTGYGMTETNGAITLMVGDEFTQDPKAAGRLVATIEAEIRDEGGARLGVDGIGEIFVRGATLMAGYANVEPPFFDKDGWFATGDLGRLDSAGRLYILDRRTDMVLSGGENIYSVEVEQAINLHPAVRESAAFGEADDRLGERLVALAVLEAGQTASSDELLAALPAHLARYKIPKKLLVTRTPLPRNPSGKIIKRQLQQGEG